MGNRILIINESQLEQEVLFGLMAKGFPHCSIHMVDNGQQCIQSAVDEPSDLIILDWDLHNNNGLSILQQLKDNYFIKNVPILVLMGNSYYQQIKTVFDAGAADVVMKPLEEEEFYARIKHVLNFSDSMKLLEKHSNHLTQEINQNERILHSILPTPILDRIKEYGSIPPKRYKDCVAFFVDIVDFTSKSGKMSPGTLLHELHDLFSGFDKVINEHYCTRIKTVGDAYIAVCGMFYQPDNIAVEAALAAVKIREYIMKRNEQSEIKWEIKVGLFNGDIIGSSVSQSNLSFDIFGETVNMASRFQTMCEPMQINVSEQLKKPLSEYFKLITRVPRKVKGKGVMPMYYIHHQIKDNNKEEPVYTPDPSLQ